MSLESRPPALLRFGIFEVDLRSGEVRKQGARIKLQEQPFLVLKALLGRPGEIVTREELRSQIWSADTFVDFDNSLNTSINKLREALGDSADNPRFIETLPRRGYRFIAPVTGLDRTTRGTSTGVSAATPTHSRKIAVTVAVVVLAAAIAGGLLWRSQQERRLTEKDTIVLADFANSTGDAVFDDTLREGLSVELEQSPFLSLVSEDGIHQTLRMMGKPANERLTPEIAQEVCQRTNSAATMGGSIALIGSQYNLIVKAVNCANGDLLASTEAQASDKSHVLVALGNVASEMRRKLGESLSTLQKYNTPLVQATTPSLEALRAYTLGMNAERDVESLAFFQRATQFDPNFAMAYWAGSFPYASMGDTDSSVESIRKAFALRAGVTEMEKLHIEVDYYYLVEGDLVKARRAAEVGSQTYPRDPNFPAGLRIFTNAVGQYETSLKQCLQFLHLRPHGSFPYRALAFAYLYLNRPENAEATVKEAQAKGQDSTLSPVLYAIAFYRGNAAEMARQVANAAGKPGDEDLLIALAADTSAYLGQLGRAREFSRQAADSAKRAGEKDVPAIYYAVSILRESLFGNATDATRLDKMTTRRSAGRDLDYSVALAVNYAGDANRGQALADDLAKKFPNDTIVQFNYLPTLRAKLALLHANPQQALDVLQVASPYELGLPAVGYYNWPNLYPVYVRGEAYLAAHRAKEAAAEFQKILDHRGIVLNEPIGALAHLQLGRAFALQGDTTKARAAYQDFLALWKDAGTDIPILKEAKTEYAKFQ